MMLKASGTICVDQLPVAERLTESGRMSASGPRGEKLFHSPLRLLSLPSSLLRVYLVSLFWLLCVCQQLVSPPPETSNINLKNGCSLRVAQAKEETELAMRTFIFSKSTNLKKINFKKTSNVPKEPKRSNWRNQKVSSELASSRRTFRHPKTLIESS